MAKTGSWVQDKIPGIEEPFIKPWMTNVADDHYQLDISAVKSALGWEPRRRLLECLPEVIRQLQQDPEQWFKEHDLTMHEPSQQEEFAHSGHASY